MFGQANHPSQRGRSGYQAVCGLAVSFLPRNARLLQNYQDQPVRIQSTLPRLMWTPRAGDNQGSKGTECAWEPGYLENCDDAVDTNNH